MYGQVFIFFISFSPSIFILIFLYHLLSPSFSFSSNCLKSKNLHRYIYTYIVYICVAVSFILKQIDCLSKWWHGTLFIFSRRKTLITPQNVHKISFLGTTLCSVFFSVK